MWAEDNERRQVSALPEAWKWTIPCLGQEHDPTPGARGNQEPNLREGTVPEDGRVFTGYRV